MEDHLGSLARTTTFEYIQIRCIAVPLASHRPVPFALVCLRVGARVLLACCLLVLDLLDLLDFVGVGLDWRQAGTRAKGRVKL